MVLVLPLELSSQHVSSSSDGGHSEERQPPCQSALSRSGEEVDQHVPEESEMCANGHKEADDDP